MVPYIGALIAWYRRWRLRTDTENPWRWCVTGSIYIWRELSRWVDDSIEPTPRFPARIFRENFRVPRVLFHRLLTDFKLVSASKLEAHNVRYCTTQYDTVGHVGIDTAVTVLVRLKRLGTGASLRDLEDRAHIGKEIIRMYMQ